MKLFVQIIGIALIISGVLWALQGLGILLWPPDSFMLAKREWGLYGGLTVAFGVLLLLLSGRFGRRG